MPSSLPAHSSHFVLIQWFPVIIQLMLIVGLLFTVVVFSSTAFAGFKYLFCHCSRLIGLRDIIYSHAISLLLHVHNQTFYARVSAFCCMMLRNPSLGGRVVRFTINQTKARIHRFYSSISVLSCEVCYVVDSDWIFVQLMSTIYSKQRL